jgi:hypothetical protein
VKKLLNSKRESLKFVIPTLAQQIWEGEYQFNKPRHKATIKAKQGDIIRCSKAM